MNHTTAPLNHTTASSKPAIRPVDEVPTKLERLAELCRTVGVTDVLLQSPASLSWLFGARSNIVNGLDDACFHALVVDAQVAPNLRVFANAAEGPRLKATELAEIDARWSISPWSEPLASRELGGSGVGSDVRTEGFIDISTEIAAVRRVLSAGDTERLRALCRDAAEAVREAAQSAFPKMTEYQLAGNLSRSLLARGLEPACMFVSGGSRMARDRHPLPTSETLGDRAMLVCCARRDGLIGSVTRIVCLKPIPLRRRERYEALLEVERAVLDASIPGRRLGDIVTAVADAYGANGFDPDEWKRHHQGGLTGWQPREFLATQADDLVVPRNSAVGWNPTADGWKLESTSLVCDDGPEILDVDPAWPTVIVGGRKRPDLLAM